MEYVVAIDLGTSKVVGMVARKDDIREFTIVALEKENTSSLVKRGYVHNVGDLALVIKRVLKKLENKINKTITKVYINLNGQSLHAQEHVITYSMHEEETITQELLDKLKHDVSKIRVESGLILDVVDPEYFINNKLEQSPVGVPCSQIECHYKLIIGKTSFKKNIERCFERIGNVEIAGYRISPLATATAVLSNNDKNLGCALVEFGAGVTTLSVYKNNLLRYLITVPFGGENITKDICKLNVLEKYAERLKIEIGNCFPNDENEEDTGKMVSLKSNEFIGETPEIEIKKLNEYIFARQNEIVLNVLNQLKISGYKEQLAAGIVIAGGASEMKGLMELIKSQIDIPVKQADIFIPVEVVQQSLLSKPAGYEQILGMLWHANKNCVFVPENIPPVKEFDEEILKVEENEDDTAQKKAKSNPFKELGKKINKIGNLFGDDTSSDL